MGLYTKTYWLTDRQSHCNIDFDLDFVSGESYKACTDRGLVRSAKAKIFQ
jgi:hypothetical protein